MWATTGRDLTRLFASGYRDMLIPRLVAHQPQEAVARVTSFYGVAPSFSGENIDGIRLLRTLLARRAADSDAHIPNAVMITAPHTHWRVGQPILVSKTERGYIVGEREPDPDAIYHPVSFALSEGKALPYEWADQSAALAPEALALILPCIEGVASDLADETPLGLAVDYRFRTSLSAPGVSTLEIGEAPHPALIVPIKRRRYLAWNHDIEQVAWQGFSVEDVVLDPAGEMAAEEIRQLLDDVDSEEEFLQIQAQVKRAYGLILEA